MILALILGSVLAVLLLMWLLDDGLRILIDRYERDTGERLRLTSSRDLATPRTDADGVVANNEPRPAISGPHRSRQ